ncbi:MAG: ribonuclease III [Phycisphaerae bacterium]|nr:ribonuclease III [Phycisphaerae bacterium]MDD5380227.1 ribonuclease III [Phycisphaerae bacterium]
MDEGTLQQIEQVIGYKFSNRELLSKAFSHSSAVDDRLFSNERLEFLGDSILGAVICRALFERFPGYMEGDLTKIKSMLVSRRTCARITKRLGLQEFLKIGKGMASSRALTSSLAAGLLEAVIAAIYIDGGFGAADDFVLRIFAPEIDRTDSKQSHGNFKSLLQQHAQQQFNTTPNYVLLDEKGPDHDKCFESEVVIDERHFPSAWGTNKKEAEQKAAFNALVELGVLEGTLPDVEI